MTRSRTLWFSALTVLAAVSCSSFAPVKITAGDQCFRCRRTIADARMAGEVITGSFVSKFRAPGCMATYLVDHPADANATMYVTDYPSGKMIAPAAAFFVPVLMNRDTGERDYRAYRLQRDADAAAAELGTASLTWPTVLAKARS